MFLTDLQVRAVITAACSKVMLSRAWLLDSMTLTNSKDITLVADGKVLVRPGWDDIIEVKRPEGQDIPAIPQGTIVGVKAANGDFTGFVADDGGIAVHVGILAPVDQPALHRLGVFDPLKFLGEFKGALGVNKFTVSLQSSGKTTLGRFIENMIVIQYPTKMNAFGYMNSVLNPEKILKMIADGCHSIPPTVTVGQYKEAIDNLYFLNHITEMCATSMTERSLMTDPRVAEVRKKFIEEHKGQMNNPLVIKQLEDELKALDREWLGVGTDHEDPSVTFFNGLGGKSWDIHRKKMFLTTGGIPAFDAASGKFDFIENSLSEGWTPEALPSIANEIRKGSYERGIETAKGGAETKLVMRVFQDVTVSVDDCGTKRTTPMDFRGICRIQDFIGRTINYQGKDILLTNENYKDFDNQVLNVYSPMTCATPRNFCFKCCGHRSKELGADVLGVQVVKITSKYMNTAMKNMHGTALKVLDVKLKDIFL